MRLRNLETIRLNTILSADRVARTMDPRRADSGRAITWALLALLCVTTPAAAQYTGVTGVIGSVPSGPASNEVLRMTLRDAINMALRYNLGAIESGENTQIARGQRLIALSNLLPHVSAGVSENIAQTSLATLGIKHLPGIPNVLGPYSYSTVDASLSETLFSFEYEKPKTRRDALRKPRGGCVDREEVSGVTSKSNPYRPYCNQADHGKSKFLV